MASKEELYISISPKEYRANKLSILGCQIDLLQTLKRLHNLSVLARQKHDLKIRLQKLLSSTMLEIDSAQSKMPTPQVPKTIIKKPEEPKIVKETKRDLSIQSNIDEELRSIQEKLQTLNG